MLPRLPVVWQSVSNSFTVPNQKMISLDKILSRELGDSVRLRTNVPAESLCTFKLGGKLSLLIEPRSLSALKRCVKIITGESSSYRVLGSGSNLLITDEGISEPVIHLGREFIGSYPLGQQIEEITELPAEETVPQLTLPVKQGEKDSLICCVLAGTSLMSLSRKTAQLGLSGLEFAAGIPASLGGAARMNAGAHGSSISEIVRRVFVVLPDAEIRIFNKTELDYSYRHSGLESAMVVLAVELSFSLKEPEVVKGARQEALEYRKKTQPLQFPSAGSVFKNPSIEEIQQAQAQHPALVKLGDNPSAGALIEAAGFKGKGQGGVAVSDIHANWIIKRTVAAKAQDVLILISHVREVVAERFGINLQLELQCWP